MSQGGRFNAIALERVVFGRPAAEVVPGELERLGRSRACLLVSDSLRTGTSEVSDLEEALGGAAVGTYSGMPPHTPREAVIECAALARGPRLERRGESPGASAGQRSAGAPGRARVAGGGRARARARSAPEFDRGWRLEGAVRRGGEERDARSMHSHQSSGDPRSRGRSRNSRTCRLRLTMRIWIAQITHETNYAGPCSGQSSYETGRYKVAGANTFRSSPVIGLGPKSISMIM